MFARNIGVFHVQQSSKREQLTFFTFILLKGFLCFVRILLVESHQRHAMAVVVGNPCDQGSKLS